MKIVTLNLTQGVKTVVESINGFHTNMPIVGGVKPFDTPCGYVIQNDTLQESSDEYGNDFSHKMCVRWMPEWFEWRTGSDNIVLIDEYEPGKCVITIYNPLCGSPSKAFVFSVIGRIALWVEDFSPIEELFKQVDAD